MQTWMRGGKILMYFHGNLDKQLCLDVAEKTRNTLNLEPISFDELPRISAMKFE